MRKTALITLHQVSPAVEFNHNLCAFVESLSCLGTLAPKVSKDRKKLKAFFDRLSSLNQSLSILAKESAYFQSHLETEFGGIAGLFDLLVKEQMTAEENICNASKSPAQHLVYFFNTEKPQVSTEEIVKRILFYMSQAEYFDIADMNVDSGHGHDIESEIFNKITNARNELYKK